MLLGPMDIAFVNFCYLDLRLSVKQEELLHEKCIDRWDITLYLLIFS